MGYYGSLYGKESLQVLAALHSQLNTSNGGLVSPPVSLSYHSRVRSSSPLPASDAIVLAGFDSELLSASPGV